MTTRNRPKAATEVLGKQGERIVVLAPRSPFPVHSGGSRVIAHRAQALERSGQNVTVVIPGAGNEERMVGAIRILSYRSQRDRFPWRLPYGAHRRMPTADGAAWIRFNNLAPSVVVVEHAAMLPAAKHLGRAMEWTGATTVLSLHSDPKKAARAAFGQSMKQPWHSHRDLFLALEQLGLSRLEQRSAQSGVIDRLIVLSPRDRDRTRRWGIPTTLVPIAYDVVKHPALAEDTRKTGRENLLYLASYQDPGNQNAATWLAEKVLPTLPDRFRLVLAGRDAWRLIERLKGRERVEIVDSPERVDGLYQSASAVAVPGLWGSGVRVKLLEAVAWGVPVVTHESVISETLFSTGTEILVGSNHVDFGAHVECIAANPRDAHARALRAQRTLHEHYSTGQVDELIVEALGLSGRAS